MYEVKPEIIFDKKINSIHTTDSNELSFHGYTIDIDENSFYNETLVLVSKNTSSKEEKKISQRRVILFRPSKEFKSLVNE